MEDVTRQAGRQPASMIECPRCRGTGRVGPDREPCRACWCGGQVEEWKARQLVDEDARRNGAAARTASGAGSTAGATAENGGGNGGAADREPDAAALATSAGLFEPCVKCGPTERCPQCPFGPFRLAA